MSDFYFNLGVFYEDFTETIPVLLEGSRFEVQYIVIGSRETE